MNKESKYNALIAQMQTATLEGTYLSLSKNFRSLSDYENAEELAEECDRKHKELRYTKLLSILQTTKNANMYKTLAKDFHGLGNYKDVALLIKVCDRRYHEMMGNTFIQDEESDRKYQEVFANYLILEYSNALNLMHNLYNENIQNTLDLQGLAYEWYKLYTTFFQIGNYMDAKSYSSHCYYTYTAFNSAIILKLSVQRINKVINNANTGDEKSRKKLSAIIEKAKIVEYKRLDKIKQIENARKEWEEQQKKKEERANEYRKQRELEERACYDSTAREILRKQTEAKGKNPCPKCGSELFDIYTKYHGQDYSCSNSNCKWKTWQSV